jgi:hypothetical protein
LFGQLKIIFQSLLIGQKYFELNWSQNEFIHKFHLIKIQEEIQPMNEINEEIDLISIMDLVNE